MRSKVVTGKAMIGALAALVLLIAVASASAQAPESTQEAWKPKPRLGVKAGVNFSHAEVSGGSSKRTGGQFGGFVAFPLQYFSLQMEALFSQKGFKQNENSGQTNVEVKYSYFELPLLFRGNIPLGEKTQAYVFAGGGLGFLFNAEGRDVAGGGDWEDISDDVTDVAWAWQFGAGLEVWRFFVEGRYSHGTTNLADVDAQFPVFEDRTFSLLVGYMFGKEGT